LPERRKLINPDALKLVPTPIPESIKKCVSKRTIPIGL
jgi:hypothetical protein